MERIMIDEPVDYEALFAATAAKLDAIEAKLDALSAVAASFTPPAPAPAQ